MIIKLTNPLILNASVPLILRTNMYLLISLYISCVNFTVDCHTGQIHEIKIA